MPNDPSRVVCAQSDSGLSASFRVSSLPPEVLERHPTRLALAAGAFIFASVSIHLAFYLFQPESAEAQRTPFAIGNTIFMVAISVAIGMAARLGWMKPANLLWLGLAYEVLTAAGIGVSESIVAWRQGELVHSYSTITAWIAVFGVMVPVPPLLSLVTGFLAATSGPVAHVIVSNYLGFEPLPMNRLLLYYFPPYLTAMIAAFVAGRMLRLECSVERAKDLGSYELEELIARGGMGEVWRARHRLLKRESAIKLIRPEILLAQTGRQADVLRRRFEQEARATAALRSPHTVELFDFGLSEDGGFYYVMELLEGFDLEQLVKRFGPQPPGRVLHILRHACLSLEDAHQQGLVHRDIKPTNLFLCKLGTTHDFTKLLDFGLVKRTISGEMTRVTMDGMTTGTPAYMAPEVALGTNHVDGRTDLYGLGCVAYWLLTGQLVFQENSATAIALAHVQKAPERPSLRVETAIPKSLEDVILACLEKKPEDRPQSAMALYRMLADCKGCEPWTEDQAARWWRVNMPGNARTPSVEAAAENLVQ
jgi:serine/threonine-protein kinase